MKTKTKPLTKAQLRVFDFIVDHYATEGDFPTIRAVMAHLNFRSANGVKYTFNVLQRKGYIEFVPTSSTNSDRTHHRFAIAGLRENKAFASLVKKHVEEHLKPNLNVQKGRGPRNGARKAGAE